MATTQLLFLIGDYRRRCFEISLEIYKRTGDAIEKLFRERRSNILTLRWWIKRILLISALFM